MNNPNKMALKARLRANKLKKDFLEKWGEFPLALPSGGGGLQAQEQTFNQAENPAQGGLSIEGRIPGSSERNDGT
ncbi:hypothetical protein LCGC14_2857250 [marine sediment metagenome]|uniref:Uncharacterized protein n=1 Tax=marine sediment metagenome TaxID=412755 RepID=A0A0F8YTG7_9ZZZZ